MTSLLVIGVVGAFATGSTMALFNDTEVSDDNVFAAGELDLQIDHDETYNGEYLEESSFPLVDNPNAFFTLDDVKPGDTSNSTISLHLEDNPGYIWMQLNQTSDAENGCTEPEEEVDTSCADPGEGLGELDDELEMVLWYDDGDGVRQGSETIIANGTASEVLNSPVALDSDVSSSEQTPFDPSNTRYIGVEWNLPRETGNVVQSDSFSFDAVFFTEQARHNDNPDNPFN